MTVHGDPRSNRAQRVDPRLRALVDRAAAGELRHDALVAVFVRFAGSPRALGEHGLHVRSVAGDVATADVALGDVPRAARATPVVFLELGGSPRPGGAG